MRILRDASEEEMILTFLREELNSERFREPILKALENVGVSENLILEGDIADEKQNFLRGKVLGLFRGYPDREIFENYPRDAVWKYAAFEASDLDKLSYVDYSYWNELSKGTSNPVRAAETVRNGEEIYGISNQYYLEGKKMLEQGMTFPPLIVLTSGNETYLILEGHCRATAYALLPKAFEGTKAYVGFCSAEALLRKAPNTKPFEISTEPMKDISLCIMTEELCRELFKGWENDPAIYTDMNLFAPYRYDEKAVNRYFDSKQDSTRVLFAIMKDDKPIGELQLKQIDYERKECTLSIHMQNDSVKGHGYGTQAERLALRYAFDVLGMTAVNADTVIKNTRSRHVLEKVGFQYIGEADGFKYYRYVCDKYRRKI